MSSDVYEIVNSGLYNKTAYRNYLDDQISDGFGNGVDYKYLPYLSKIIPKFDFSSAKVLDVGAREFETWNYFKANYSAEIVGIDVCRVALEKAQKDKKPLIEMDAHAMDRHFRPKSFDLIVSFHAFEHMFDLDRVLCNCITILKPLGLLYFALPMPSKNLGRGHYQDVPNNKTMVARLENAGFIVLHHILSCGRFRPGQEMLGLAIRPGLMSEI